MFVEDPLLGVTPELQPEEHARSVRLTMHYLLQSSRGVAQGNPE